LFVTVVLACNSPAGRQSEQASSSDVTETNTSADSNGLFLFQLPCASDPSVHYSLYLPVNYTGSDLHPLLLLFDPHGDDRGPLQRYKALADRYGFILMSAVENRNGNDARITAGILHALDRECNSIARADTNNLNCGGFSGGARIAAMLALGSGRYKGLILSGAGFPSGNWKGIPPHIVIGYAGQRDMNLGELRQLKPEAGLEGRFQFITSDGAHAWPDSISMEKAFIALLCSSSRDHYGKAPDSLLKFAVSRYRDWISLGSDKGQPLLQSYNYLNFLRCFDGLTEISKEEIAYYNLLSSATYQSAVKKEEQLMKEEEKKEKELTSAFMQRPPEWWQAEMSSWMDTSTFATDKPRVAMHCRVQGKLSLIAYSSTNRALEAGMQNESRYFSALYVAIDPGNKEAWYLLALTFAREGKMGQAMESLEKSASLGFNERTRLEVEMAFAPLHADNRYQTILNQMH
jgi:pimeloyl-ACP methyl ester carboxylesterase